MAVAFGIRGDKLIVCRCGHYSHDHTKWNTEYSKCRYSGSNSKYGNACKCEGVSNSGLLIVGNNNAPTFRYGMMRHRVDVTGKEWEVHYPLDVPLQMDSLDVEWLVSECERCLRSVSFEGDDRLYPWSRLARSEGSTVSLLQVLLLCEECNSEMGEDGNESFRIRNG
jgi:DNA repair exonuclease SbcCD nuclease subunit